MNPSQLTQIVQAGSEMAADTSKRFSGTVWCPRHIAILENEDGRLLLLPGFWHATQITDFVVVGTEDEVASTQMLCIRVCFSLYQILEIRGGLSPLGDPYTAIQNNVCFTKSKVGSVECDRLGCFDGIDCILEPLELPDQGRHSRQNRIQPAPDFPAVSEVVHTSIGRQRGHGAHGDGEKAEIDGRRHSTHIDSSEKDEAESSSAGAPNTPEKILGMVCDPRKPTHAIAVHSLPWLVSEFTIPCSRDGCEGPPESLLEQFAPPVKSRWAEQRASQRRTAG